jgi:hypothetical protein
VLSFAGSRFVGSVIRAPKDLWVGIIYAAAGAAGFLMARDYPFGSGARMGPGYFPTIISFLLIVLGAISIVRAFIADGPRIGSIAWKAIILVIGSVLAFAFLLDTAGFIVAATALLLLSAAASERFRFEWQPALGLIGLVAFCSLVFVKGLGLAMPLVGPWLQPMMPAWPGG